MSPFVADLREYISHSRSVPIDQDRAEVRIYAALLTVVAGYFLFVEPIFVMCTVPQSPLHRVASLAPSMWCVVVAFAIAVAGIVPHLLTLLFQPTSLRTRWPRKIAAYSTVVAATAWIYLTNLSLPLDLGSVEWSYGFRALISIALGFSYGFSLNAQQGREILHAEK